MIAVFNPSARYDEPCAQRAMIDSSSVLAVSCRAVGFKSDKLFLGIPILPESSYGTRVLHGP
jgi:hypothetical protein